MAFARRSIFAFAVKYKRHLTLLICLTAAVAFSFLLFRESHGGNTAANLASTTQPQRPSLQSQLGQNFVIGIPGPTLDSSTIQELNYIKPGGIILYFRNFESKEQLTNLISDLQTIAMKTTGEYYFIMVDEEPGGASRFGLFQGVFDLGIPDWAHITADVETMKEVGLNVDLAPVSDFPFNGDSFIADRMPARTIPALLDFNQGFINILNENGISATLKHFPGMGIFTDDPHLTLPSSTIAESTLQQSLNIFQAGIGDGADFVMTGHAIYTNIDPKYPATLSKTIVTGILRDQLKFQGLIITDDLSDMPFTLGLNLTLASATIMSLEAGHNLVIFSHEFDETENTFAKISQATQSDPELQQTIQDNYDRIVQFKTSHGNILTPISQ